MDKFDVVIIGGGLGGLSCGAILSKEGLSVCILERHNHIGGCLQSFKRKGYSLDTGMHYVGNLSEGDTLYQYFKYFGILDKIRFQQLDIDGFDVINLGNGKIYYNNDAKMLMSQITINGDENIDLDIKDSDKSNNGSGGFCRYIRYAAFDNIENPDSEKTGNDSSSAARGFGFALCQRAGRLVL